MRALDFPYSRQRAAPQLPPFGDGDASTLEKDVAQPGTTKNPNLTQLGSSTTRNSRALEPEALKNLNLEPESSDPQLKATQRQNFNS